MKNRILSRFVLLLVVLVLTPLLYSASPSSAATTAGSRQAETTRRVSFNGISFTFFTSRDVVRHPLVAKIVRAYEAFEQKPEEPR